MKSRRPRSETEWLDWQRVLGQVTLLGVDYYTTSLVNSYGETEDIPSGNWLAPVWFFEIWGRRKCQSGLGRLTVNGQPNWRTRS